MLAAHGRSGIDEAGNTVAACLGESGDADCFTAYICVEAAFRKGEVHSIFSLNDIVTTDKIDTGNKCSKMRMEGE